MRARCCAFVFALDVYNFTGLRLIEFFLLRQPFDLYAVHVYLNAAYLLDGIRRIEIEFVLSY